MDSDDKLRKAHYENYKTVRRALIQSERATKYAIRTSNAAMVEALTLNQMMLVTIKSEARLMKLLFLPGGFTKDERETIVSEQTAADKWLATLHLAYRKGFKIKASKDLRHSLNHDNNARYQSILQVFDEHLKPMITMRNKLAHGQWARPLNNDNTAVEPISCKFLATENGWSLIGRDRAIEGIANILGDLIQSRALYEAQFNEHYRPVQLLTSPDRTDYETWLRGLKTSHEKGMKRLAVNMAKLEAETQEQVAVTSP